jgi:multidrug efflux pump subunit AcrA (membrane-fusion protein)
MTMKRMLGIGVLLMLLVGCNRSSVRVPAGEVAGVGTADAGLAEENATATSQPTQAVSGTTVLANGELVAVNAPLALSFKSGGQLLEIQVAAGERVSAGDLVATLDDEALAQAVTNAELAVTQAENGLAQAELSLDDLLEWEPDEMAVKVAEANLAAAQAGYEQAQASDAAAGNSLTSAQVSLNQAQRALGEAQEAYDNAHDEARDWELNYNEPICLPGQGGAIPCSGPTWQERIKNDRDFTERALQNAQDGLTVARANYALAQAGLSDNSAIEADAAVANAEQALHQAESGPEESQIAAARLQVEQAEVALAQADYGLELARQALEDAKLIAPADGTVLSVDAAMGATVAPGTPIITLLDTEALEFHTDNLSERDLAFIEPGQPAEINLKTYSGEAIEGEVAFVVPQASGQVGDAATFTVVISIGATELELLPGMTGRVEIQREAE